VQANDGIDQPAFNALLELKKTEKAWVKVCGSERISPPPYSAAAPFARKLIEVAPDRTLWGTDFPHPNLNHKADDAALVDLVPNFAVTPEAQKRLLVDNPMRLYDFTN
jgi:predicted TIM-barrel fold metal-dependent hydrolase